MSEMPHTRQCAYCGQPASGEDHIPPQSLLRGVPRGKRPHVPACSACNTGASNDDEYFRDTVLKYHRVSDKPEAQSGIEAMVRGVRNARKRWYAEAMLRSFYDVRVETRSGINLGLQPAYRVDATRLARACERYIRGLHVIARGAPIPADHWVRVHLNVEDILARQSEIASFFHAGTTHMVGERIFWYKIVIPLDRPSASAWLLVFFDAFPILGVVHPPAVGPVPPPLCSLSAP
jgi:hypothetical protein